MVEKAEESESSGETASGERPNMQNMGISLTRVVTGTKMVGAGLRLLLRSSE